MLPDHGCTVANEGLRPGVRQSCCNDHRSDMPPGARIKTTHRLQCPGQPLVPARQQMFHRCLVLGQSFVKVGRFGQLF